MHAKHRFDIVVGVDTRLFLSVLLLRLAAVYAVNRFVRWAIIMVSEK